LICIKNAGGEFISLAAAAKLRGGSGRPSSAHR
jgi:hypothetical protein